MIETGLLTWLIDKGIEFAPRLLARARHKALQRFKNDTRQQINDVLAGNAVVHGPYAHEPCLDIRPRHILPASEATLAVELRERWRGERPNDPHGLILNPLAWQDDPLAFVVSPLDFAELNVLRESAHSAGRPPPQVLSASALVVCREERKLLLHRRSQSSATYPAHLHTIGGGYWPPGIEGRDGDGDSLRHTVVREVHEETRVNLQPGNEEVILVLEETRTGFVQLLFLGSAISSHACASVSDSVEGHPVWLEFDDLPSRLVADDESWVPTGLAAVLAWLALRAPGAGPWPRFGGQSPNELFRNTMEALRARQSVLGEGPLGSGS